MPVLAASNIPTPKSWDEFEDIVLSAAKIRWKSSDFFRQGRQGQRQDGVDVFGQVADKRQIGVQGKNSIGGVTEATVKREIKQAESFTPPIDALYIATTAKRDAKIQKAVRLISKARVKAGKFPVAILFWEDICLDLCTDDAAFFRHYPQLRPKVDPVREHDAALFERLSQLLASKGVIRFLDQQNMAGFSFVDSALDPLREFYYNWNTPDREFITPEIEAVRKKMWAKVDDYLEVIAMETDSTGPSLTRRWVPQDLEITDSERFHQIVKRLHTLAREIVALHRELIRTARSHLVGEASSQRR
jgi:hypothetical protein